ncbi:MAG: ATP-dependent chaperone ClpB, partial [Verrucomicrobiales bacterium]|nr:ATP-dependent chaperone ClpB [Verrucomicrobiales bacterium]
MTSNIGSPIIHDFYSLEKSKSPTAQAELDQLVKAELRKYFRPEFLNRVDEIIIFRSLDEEQLEKIVDIQLRTVEKRLAQQRLTLNIDSAAKKLIAREGYDPQFGARPLKRAIQDKLLNPLAVKLLDGEFKPGDRIKVTADGEVLKFAKK